MKELVFIEPTQSRLGHSICNASLLSAVVQVWPDLPIRLLSTEEHMAELTKIIEYQDPSVSKRLVWESIDPESIRQNRNFEIRWYGETVKRFSESRIFWLSASNLGLYSLSRAPMASCECSAVVVHQLASLVANYARKPWLWKYHLRSVLRHWNSRTVPLILGSSLLENARRLVPSGTQRLRCINIPRIMVEARPSTQDNIELNVGFIGVTSKGFDSFVEIAKQCVSESLPLRFTFAGAVNSAIPGDSATFVRGLETIEDIHFAELEQKIGSLDIALWLGNPIHYRLTCSATFVDAMVHGVPVIGIRNDFADMYFRQYGAGGICLDSIDDIVKQLKMLVDDGVGSIRSWRCGAKEIGKAFSPNYVALQLASALEE